MKKIISLLLVFATAVTFASCGSKADVSDESKESQKSSETVATTSSSSEDGYGYKSSMAKACGFEMGKKTLEEVLDEYGRDYTKKEAYTEEATGDRLIRLIYPDSITFLFSSQFVDSDEKSVLISVTVSGTSKKAGPAGIKIGMDKYEASELVFKGAEEKMKSSEKAVLNGDGFFTLYGKEKVYHETDKVVFPPFCKYYPKVEDRKNVASEIVFGVVHDGFTGNVEDLGYEIIYTRLNKLDMCFDKNNKLISYSVSYTADAE